MQTKQVKSTTFAVAVVFAAVLLVSGATQGVCAEYSVTYVHLDSLQETRYLIFEDDEVQYFPDPELAKIAQNGLPEARRIEEEFQKGLQAYSRQTTQSRTRVNVLELTNEANRKQKAHESRISAEMNAYAARARQAAPAAPPAPSAEDQRQEQAERDRQARALAEAREKQRQEQQRAEQAERDRQARELAEAREAQRRQAEAEAERERQRRAEVARWAAQRQAEWQKQAEAPAAQPQGQVLTEAQPQGQAVMSEQEQTKAVNKKLQELLSSQETRDLLSTARRQEYERQVYRDTASYSDRKYAGMERNTRLESLAGWLHENVFSSGSSAKEFGINAGMSVANEATALTRVVPGLRLPAKGQVENDVQMNEQHRRINNERVTSGDKSFMPTGNSPRENVKLMLRAQDAIQTGLLPNK